MLSSARQVFKGSGHYSVFQTLIRLLASSSASYWRLYILWGKILFDFDNFLIDSHDIPVNFATLGRYVTGHMSTWPEISISALPSRILCCFASIFFTEPVPKLLYKKFHVNITEILIQTSWMNAAVRKVQRFSLYYEKIISSSLVIVYTNFAKCRQEIHSYLIIIFQYHNYN